MTFLITFSCKLLVLKKLIVHTALFFFYSFFSRYIHAILRLNFFINSYQINYYKIQDTSQIQFHKYSTKNISTQICNSLAPNFGTTTAQLLSFLSELLCFRNINSSSSPFLPAWSKSAPIKPFYQDFSRNPRHGSSRL